MKLNEGIRPPCFSSHGKMVDELHKEKMLCDNGNRPQCERKCTGWLQYTEYVESIKRRVYEERWHTGGPAVVSHPDYGEIVVPHTSNFCALLNAAELWGCDWMDIRDATVMWVPKDTPMKTPWNYERRAAV